MKTNEKPKNISIVYIERQQVINRAEDKVTFSWQGMVPVEIVEIKQPLIFRK